MLWMRRYPLTDLTQPKNGLFQIYVDRWWPTTTQGELYFLGSDRSPFSSPQCNMNRELAERLGENLSTSTSPKGYRYEDYQGVVQIPLVYVPVNISDYT